MISNDCATNTFETTNFWPIKSQSLLVPNLPANISTSIVEKKIQAMIRLKDATNHSCQNYAVLRNGLDTTSNIAQSL